MTAVRFGLVMYVLGGGRLCDIVAAMMCTCCDVYICVGVCYPKPKYYHLRFIVPLRLLIQVLEVNA